MQILKAYKFRLEPTEQQAQRLPVGRLCSLCLESRAGRNQTHSGCWRKLPSAFELNRMLTSWKKDPEMAFLAEAYTDNLQQKLKDLHGAWMRCFDKNSPPRHPYSRKSDNRDAIRFVNFDKYCRLEKGRVKLPAGLAWVKFRQSQPVEGKLKTRPSAKQPGTGISPFRSSRRRLSQFTSGSMVGLDAGIAARNPVRWHGV